MHCTYIMHRQDDNELTTLFRFWFGNLTSKLDTKITYEVSLTIAFFTPADRLLTRYWAFKLRRKRKWEFPFPRTHLARGIA